MRVHGQIPPSTNDVSGIASALMQSGLPQVARVCDSDRATDIAMLLRSDHLAVVRCVDTASKEDHTALATMISEGDFVWGAIVYSESAPLDPLGLIESFNVDELDQLVSRLVELRGVFDEAG